jgi:hypothetical protein
VVRCAAAARGVGDSCRLLAAGAEEVGEEGAALFGEEAGDDLDFVVELGVVHDGEDGAAGAGFGVGCGVDEARDASMEDGAGTHGAGFEGDVEGAALVIFVEQAVVFEGAAGLAEGYDFGVGGGVVVAENAVLAAGDDFAAVDDDGADGDFAGEFGGAGFGYGGAEVGEVVSHHAEFFHLRAFLWMLTLGSLNVCFV